MSYFGFVRRVLGTAAVGGVVCVASPSVAAADAFLLHLEADVTAAISDPQSSEFDPGGALSLGGFQALGPNILLGARFRGGLLQNGNAPENPGYEDPGTGSFYQLHAAVRLRPFGDAGDVARGDGLFIEGGGGATLTGELFRGSVEAAIGYGLDVGDFDVAPVVRYTQVIQGSGLEDRDARLLMIGLEFVLLDPRPVPHDEPPPPPVSDRDGDGIADPRDSCPDDPEDRDGFEDSDGCPETDNDNDGILDPSDQCPNDPEDRDQFQDEDGCPDPDNDSDGILDVDDRCPLVPETVNGNEDQDGCPDEGLVTLVGDRIVLEERVLFDFERARIRHAARPVLEAIVRIQSQHPEWTSLRIEGHADVRGEAAFNQELSERRARNVMLALVQLGIPQNLIDFIGFGSERPRDAGDSEEAHARNRRVEFVVVSGAGARNMGTAEDIAGEEARQRAAEHERRMLQRTTHPEPQAPRGSAPPATDEVFELPPEESR